MWAQSLPSSTTTLQMPNLLFRLNLKNRTLLLGYRLIKGLKFLVDLNFLTKVLFMKRLCQTIQNLHLQIEFSAKVLFDRLDEITLGFLPSHRSADLFEYVNQSLPFSGGNCFHIEPFLMLDKVKMCRRFVQIRFYGLSPVCIARSSDILCLPLTPSQEFFRKDMTPIMVQHIKHLARIELAYSRWQRGILPLNHRCELSISILLILLFPKNAALRLISPALITTSY